MEIENPETIFGLRVMFKIDTKRVLVLSDFRTSELARAEDLSEKRVRAYSYSTVAVGFGV